MKKFFITVFLICAACFVISGCSFSGAENSSASGNEAETSESESGTSIDEEISTLL